MSLVASALAACRSVQDGAGLLLWGSCAYRAALVPAPLARRLAERFARGDLVLVLLACLSTVAKGAAEAANIGGGWDAVVDPGVLRAILVETSAGGAWIEQAVCCVLLAAVRALPARREAATAAASALLLAGLAMTGHAVMQEGPRGLLHRGVDIVHVLAGGAWLGALLPVVAILPRLRDTPEAGVALRRFSRAGHVAVALVLSSGAANATLVLGRWPTDWRQPYAGLLDAKVALVAAMTGLALLNRYVVVPGLGRDGSDALATLRRTTLAEVPLGLAAVALVAVFGLFDPG